MRDHRTLFLARHGETDWNAAGRWQGQTDVPLNDNGRAQARALAGLLRRHGIAAVASSDLARARATAEIVASELGLPPAVQVDPGLRERSFGRFEGLTRAECEARYPHEWARYLSDPHHAPPGAEPREALLARVLGALRRTADRVASPALVVTHGGAMRVLLRAYFAARPQPAPEWHLRPIRNGAVVRVHLARGELVHAEPVDDEACSAPAA